MQSISKPSGTSNKQGIAKRSSRPFPRKIPLGISVAMATTFLVFHALQAWMAPFKFEVNWMFNGVDMTSQTYTHFIWAHNYRRFGLEVPPVQISHMGLYKMCISL